MIINMSERIYDFDKMPGHVITVNFRGLPAPPLDVLCRLCLQIHQWKSRNRNNLVVVHCFPGYSRSAVLISCYQAWSGICNHPVDALIDVCRGLKIDENDSILPSQKRYLNYFFDLLTNGHGTPPNQASGFRVRKLIFTGIPNIPLSEDGKFRPFYEIWTNGKLVYSSLPRDVPVETLVESVVTAYEIIDPQTEIVAGFDDSNNVSDDQPICKGDVLFRIRHLSPSGVRYTCLRFAFNTNYVFDNVLHLSQHEIDGNNFPKCVVELVFEPSTTSVPLEGEEKLLFERSYQVSSRLRQGLSIDEDTERDVEEVLLAKALGLDQGRPSLDRTATTNPATSRSVSDVSKVPVIPIHDNTTVGNSGDDVDDFFAQLEREAKM